MNDTNDNTMIGTKAVPSIENDESKPEVRISKRTGRPVRKYTHTGRFVNYLTIRAKGISPRTGKPVRTYIYKNANKIRETMTELNEQVKEQIAISKSLSANAVKEAR